MEQSAKPYVLIAIDSVHAVVLDPEGRYDADRHDRYLTFTEARDAALCCNEAMIDESDYDDEAHREELERMLALLEPAETFDHLLARAEYVRFLGRQAPAQSAAA